MNLIEITNKGGKVSLNETITPAAIKRMIDEIGKLFGAAATASGADFGPIMACAENAIDSLNIEINSVGGSVFDGYTIYNEIKSLRERGVHVTATITGMAASMASVVAMACDSIRMVPHARMMIHDASNATGGNAASLRKLADLLDGISSDIANIYAARTKKDVATIRDMMKAETWMSASEAVSQGFADEIFDIRAATPKPTGMSILSALFPGNDQVAKFEASILEIETLRADLTKSEAKVAELTGLSQVVAAKDEEITNLATERDAFKAQVATLEADLATSTNAVPSAVTETLASIGQPEPLPEGDNSGPVDHVAELGKLTGAARTAYYDSHKKEIRASLNK